MYTYILYCSFYNLHKIGIPQKISQTPKYWRWGGTVALKTIKCGEKVLKSLKEEARKNIQKVKQLLNVRFRSRNSNGGLGM